MLELLVVVVVLAILAGGVLAVFDGVEEDATFKIAQGEMMEIRKAIRQFRKDSGYLPKQGPFALTIDGGSVPVPPQGESWFKSPANFIQLLENPLTGTGHPLETWNIDTRRGWNGPYLGRSGEGYVTLGDNVQADGSGSPTAGGLLPDVPGMADPFTAKPVSGYLIWRTTPGGPFHPDWGRPYFLFDLDNNNARLVGMGSNRMYEAGTGDDLVVYLLK